MSHLAALPVLIPLLAASVALALRKWRRVQEAISIAAAAATFVVSLMLLAAARTEGLVVSQIGGWPAPFGVTFVVDLLSSPLLVAVCALTLLGMVYATRGAGRAHRDAGLLPLLLVLLAGVCGALLTSDLFNLYVWFEVMLMASFVVLALGGTRAQLEGALKYVTLNFVASVLLLSSVGLLYGKTGTLSFADMSLRLASIAPGGTLIATAILLLTAFAIKAASFPFFFWLPASYHTPPAVVSALFAGTLTKVGVYAMLRCGTLLFPETLAEGQWLLSFIAGATMLTGVLGAAAQKDLRRILSFHIVSQIGYMIMGLAIGGVLGVAGALFFILHNIVAKSALFLASGVVEHERGTGTLDELGGIARERPLLAALFFVPALSLAGIPPLSGFVGKLLLVRAGLEAERWVVTAVAIAVSLLTLYSMLKMWLQAFWAPSSGENRTSPPAPRRMVATLALVAAATVLLGVLAEPVVDLCLDAARQSLDREAYARAVLAAGAAP